MTALIVKNLNYIGIKKNLKHFGLKTVTHTTKTNRY